MATRTGIQNTSGVFIMLPPPYAGALPAGVSAVVADTPAIVIAALGGASFIKNALQINTLPSGTAVTAHNRGIGGNRYLATAGSNGAGAVTFTGAKVGDAVSNVANMGDGTDATSSFESTVSVADQVQQTSVSNLSAKKILIVLLAKS